MATRSSKVIAFSFWLTAIFFIVVLFSRNGTVLPPTQKVPNQALPPSPKTQSSSEKPSFVHDDLTNVEESDYADYGTPRPSFVPDTPSPAVIQTAPANPPTTSSKILNISQRMDRSERAWQESIDTRHEIKKQYYLAKPESNSIPLFDGQRLPGFPGGGAYYTIWDFFPPSYSCPWDIQRVGRFADGGKWVCGLSKYEEEKERNLVIYSFGVEQDSAFEEAMLSKTNAEIFAYDFSVDGFGGQLTADHQNRSHFTKVGLSGEDEMSKSPPFYTLKSLMKLNEHDYIDILKVDVEGSEYAAFDRFMDDFENKPLPIGQLMIELHLFDDENVNFERFYRWWERLESFGMRPTWLEVNLIQTILVSSAPSRDPRCTEYVWVNTMDPKSVLWKD
ncbi:MAG: hypothetical protein M1817_002509 [Caeruleum heppii]|nr:MAG: hypothetical protein M1817_002509 [Caeruleum heppii]